MPTNNDKYKQERIVLLAKEARTLHLKLKDLIHNDKIRHQGNIPTRKQMISMGTVYTRITLHATKLAKARDKKLAKASGKSNGSKLRVVRINDTLSKFLCLKERGLPENVYSDTLVTSNWTNWGIANGRQEGKIIKLYGRNDPFVQLFMNDLKELGSGPTTKITNSNGVVEKVLSRVLDEDGNQINDFFMNKHMKIFANHYPLVPKTTSNKYELGRDVVNKDEYPELYSIMQKEHGLFTGDLKALRKRYCETQKKLKELNDKKDRALEVGDRSINDSIYKATTEYKQAKQAYVTLMNANNIQHIITL